LGFRVYPEEVREFTIEPRRSAPPAAFVVGRDDAYLRESARVCVRERDNRLRALRGSQVVRLTTGCKPRCLQAYNRSAPPAAFVVGRDDAYLRERVWINN